MAKLQFQKLDQRIAGDVTWSDLDRLMLATDASIYQRKPAAVVYPRETADVEKTVFYARRHGLSIHPRGAGSGLCGSALGTGIVIDFTRYMNRLIDIDLERKTFTCEPGYRFGELSKELSGKNLFFPPDPSSGEYASFGGMVGTNASGAHSVKYGNVSDYLKDARIVLSTGTVVRLQEIAATPVERLPVEFNSLACLYEKNKEIIESGYPEVRYNVTGYNLRGMVKNGRLRLQKLFCGSEGTLGLATELTFHLLDKPAADSLVVAYFDSIEKSSRAVQAILPMAPAGIEVMDKSLLSLARRSDSLLRDRIPTGIDNVLLVEFDGDELDSTTAAGEAALSLMLKKKLCTQAYLAISADEKKRFWALRKAAVPILYRLKGEKKILALIEDAVVPTDRLVEYFSGIYQLLDRYGVQFVVYGHIAKGLLHTRPLLNLKDPRDIDLLKILADGVFELVNGLGGVVSGEHGDGRIRSTYIQRQYPDLYPLFEEVKRLLDPHNLMNPEIKTASTPDQMMQHLRYGSEYRRVESNLSRLQWKASWHGEIEKCHGCTKCTTVTTATRMCPVYKFTRKEAAAPKAKANVLRALIDGELKDSYLFERSFQAVIDHCVNCGSCRLECPSHVDIPKLALEARARYVDRFGPTLHSRLVTSVEALGRYGGRFSGWIEPLMQMNISRQVGETITGISRKRPFIPMAKRSLFQQVETTTGKGVRQVLYFAGCYAGYVRPAIGRALVSVLSQLGMTVHTPPQHCCGLPLMTKGRIRQARGKIRRNLAQWVDLLGRVDHIVVSCSSCGLALMEEWASLLDEPRIHQVAAKVIHASRLLGRHLNGKDLRPQAITAAYHQPCHLKVQEEPNSSVNLLRGVPEIEVTNLDSHCCGMAGTWGMAAEYDTLSRRIGGDLIQLVENSGANTAVTDCPTCEMQLAQLGRIPVMHPVEIVARSFTAL